MNLLSNFQNITLINYQVNIVCSIHIVFTVITVRYVDFGKILRCLTHSCNKRHCGAVRQGNGAL